MCHDLTSWDKQKNIKSISSTKFFFEAQFVAKMIQAKSFENFCLFKNNLSIEKSSYEGIFYIWIEFKITFATNWASIRNPSFETYYSYFGPNCKTASVPAYLSVHKIPIKLYDFEFRIKISLKLIEQSISKMWFPSLNY